MRKLNEFKSLRILNLENNPFEKVMRIVITMLLISLILDKNNQCWRRPKLQRSVVWTYLQV